MSKVPFHLTVEYWGELSRNTPFLFLVSKIDIQDPNVPDEIIWYTPGQMVASAISLASIVFFLGVIFGALVVSFL